MNEFSTHLSKRQHRVWFTLLVIWCLAPQRLLAAPLSFERDILPILRDYCIDCHDTSASKGGLDLERFQTETGVLADRSIWASVHEKIESHQMPPPKKGNQPSSKERELVLQWISEMAAKPDPKLGRQDPGKPILRRLTRLEYNNTVRDLLGLDLDIYIFPERLPFRDRSYFQPASGTMGNKLEVPLHEYGGKYRVLVPQAGLPSDSRASHGYRNRGEAMDFSPLLLEKYVQLAGEIVQTKDLPQRSPKFAEWLGLDPSEVNQKAGKGKMSSVGGSLPVFPLAGTFAPNLDGVRKPEEAPDWIAGFRPSIEEAFQEGRGGVLELNAALGGTTLAGKGGLLKAQFGERMVTVNPDADLWLVDFATANEASEPLLMTNKEKGSKTFELTFSIQGSDPDEGIERLGLCVLGRKKQQGPVTLTARFSDGTETRITSMIEEGPSGTTFFSFAAIPGETIRKLHVDGSGFSGDYVLLDDIGLITNGEVQSPAILSRARNEQSPQNKAPKAATASAPPQDKPAAAIPKKAPRPVRDRLGDFIQQAFRRPVTSEEISHFYSLFEKSRAAGRAEPEAMRLAFQAVLSSPSFLFLEMNGNPEPNETVTRLEDFELANRLAYFLWSSMPDEALMAEALAGRLTSEPGELARQVRRMLKDPRAKELSESFATQWLRLDQLYTAKPDRDLFPRYYSGPQGKTTLHGSALVEALLLFETVVVENRSILDFIHPGYTWLNTQLIQLYDLGPVARPQLEAIQGIAASPSDPQENPSQGTREVQNQKKPSGSSWFRIQLDSADRGGFLAMSAPLTLTSLPFRTSPVKRGAWLLETIFNRPPTEPKVAFAIQNDGKEANSSMSIREKFELHRNQPACYSCHIRLDPPGFALESFDPIGAWRDKDGEAAVDAGGTWGSRSFQGPAAFKQILFEDPREFTRGFVEHLLSYALNRKLEIYDMPAVDQILAHAASNQWKWNSILEAIVESYPFTHVRVSPSPANHDH